MGMMKIQHFRASSERFADVGKENIHQLMQEALSCPLATLCWEQIFKKYGDSSGDIHVTDDLRLVSLSVPR